MGCVRWDEPFYVNCVSVVLKHTVFASKEVPGGAEMLLKPLRRPWQRQLVLLVSEF